MKKAGGQTIRDVQQMQMIVSSTAGAVPETGWADVHDCCFVWKGFLEQKGANVPSFSPVEGYTPYLRGQWGTLAERLQDREEI